MKFHPILFSAPMVRAILAGTKTQTRRVIEAPPSVTGFRHFEGLRWDRMQGSVVTDTISFRYGQPGDRLWVKETCRAEELTDGLDGVRYLADDGFRPIDDTSEAVDAWLKLRDYGKRPSPAARVKTVPSIHMPRWASRINLEITGVRVERLQDISESDARAEGINVDDLGHAIRDNDTVAWGGAVLAYSELWESINGSGSWEMNPWVWVVSFRRMEACNAST